MQLDIQQAMSKIAHRLGRPQPSSVHCALFAVALATVCATTAAAADLQPRTIAAFDRYVRLTETRMDTDRIFLWVDTLPDEPGTAVALVIFLVLAVVVDRYWRQVPYFRGDEQPAVVPPDAAPADQ